jgi:hypothetical protein
MKKLFVLLALPVFLSFSSNEHAAAIPISFDTQYDETGYFYNVCNNEYMYVSWAVIVSFSGMINDNKALFSMHNRIQGEAEGLITGNHYIINETENSTESHSLINGSVTFIRTDKAKLISQGASPDMFINSRGTFVINANGEVSASGYDFEYACNN